MSDNEKPQFDATRPTLALNSEAVSTSDPMQAAEARMRRALGLDGEPLRARLTQERIEPQPRPVERFAAPGHKRRFVHDGEVPVTLVHGLVSGRRDHGDGNGGRGAAIAQPTNRLEIAEAALASEIATRERAERALQEAQATIHDLQTKLGHADLARQEAVDALRREREDSAGFRASLQEAQAQVTEARQAREAAARALVELQTNPAAVDVPPRPRRGRKPRTETIAITDSTAAEPRKPGARVRAKEAASAREPKPIRWWLTPRTKKKR